MEMKMHVRIRTSFSSLSQWSIHTLAAILIIICSTHHVVCDVAIVCGLLIARALCDVIDVDMVKMVGVLGTACLQVAETFDKRSMECLSVRYDSRYKRGQPSMICIKHRILTNGPEVTLGSTIVGRDVTLVHYYRSN